MLSHQRPETVSRPVDYSRPTDLRIYQLRLKTQSQNQEQKDQQTVNHHTNHFHRFYTPQNTYNTTNMLIHKKLLRLWHIAWEKNKNAPSRQMHTIDFIRHKILITPQICFSHQRPETVSRPVDYSRPTDLRIYQLRLKTQSQNQEQKDQQTVNHHTNHFHRFYTPQNTYNTTNMLIHKNC